MPISATYIAAQFKLRILGTSAAENLFVSRNAAGTLLVNAGAVPVTGGTSTVANTDLIEILAGGGVDIVTLDESSGALPAAMLYGAAGNDTLTGGSSGDSLFGEGQNDTLFGKGGADFLYGGLGNDILTGGDGEDQMFGDDGNDRMIWNPGDDSDLMEGGVGTDTAEVNGGNGAETFAVTANGTRVRFDRLDPAPFFLDIGTTESLVVNANGGDDTISATGNLAALIALTLDGGTGNDTILGGNGNDLLLGGSDNDFVDGNQGNDTALLGAGNDVFQWDPGDGSDIIEGQTEIDTLVFNGSAAMESFALTKNGARVLATRNIGNIVLDVATMERFTFNALGGADSITVNDLTGTGATQVDINLASTIGGSSGDAAVDLVTAYGSGAAESIVIAGAGTSVGITGLPVAINITTLEGANDGLTVNGGGGNDTIDASTVPSGVVHLVLAGGLGNDTIFGSAGGDTLFGDDGNDVIEGNQGNDTAFLGVGNDVFQWDPGDGNDVVEGQDGSDELRFNGSSASETINVIANGGRALVLRDVASVTMDLNDIEKLSFRVIGGSDSFIIGDLSGTDVTQIDLRLTASGGSGGDSAADTVTVNGTSGVDSVTVSSPGGVVKATGLSAGVSIYDPEIANDRLVIDLGGGDDTVTAASLAANLIKLTLNGGLGNDVLIGSAGSDLVSGGDGNDTALLGAGDDNFVWNPGDDNDVIEGQAGIDTLTFNGANIAENITISANGGRVVFFRDVAAVSMDMNDTETIRYAALGGADTITVNDMTGTDAKNLIFDLASTIGGASGDGQVDTIRLNGDPGNETIVATALGGGGVSVTGLPAAVALSALEAADRLTIFGGNGNDSISAATIAAAVAVVTLDGGDGNDTLYSGGDGTYLGGIGNDTIYAGLTSASEVIDGGSGIDTLDTTTWGGLYTINLVTGVTNYGGESFTNFENLTTGAGDDTVTGTDGANIIKTNAGVDSISGAGGNDTLDGGVGADSMTGGLDNDTFHVDNAGDVVVEGVSDGANDQIFASVSYTQGAGVYVERLSTNDINGVAAINLTGNELANVIRGNAGANILDGKAGKDTLTGSVGADTFRFTTAPGPTNFDRITDYDVANDVIQLDNAVFAGLPAGALAGGAFRMGSAAVDATDRIIYNSANGVLLFDADGNGVGAAVQFATLSTGLAMTASEFFII